jgi:hypothetical protein
VFFSHENNTKQDYFNTVGKQRERATTIVLWEISPKKEGAYPKREFDTEELQQITDRLQRDYKVRDILQN